MQTSNVVVYYTDLHVTEHIQHCKHLSLPEAMMSLHVFPASTKNPTQGFHFGLLDFVYLTKMIGYLSNHSWAKVLNKNNGQMPSVAIFFFVLIQICINITLTMCILFQ
ncbi:unnamed protein product [Rhizopus stolonifer]